MVSGRLVTASSLVVVVAMLVSGCRGAGTLVPSPPSPSSVLASLPADVQRLGNVRLASPVEAVGAISADAAVAAAIDEGYNWADPEPYLVVMTDDMTVDADEPIVDQVIWLVRWDDLSVEFPGPIRQDGSPAPGSTYRYAYVLVDGQTAAVLNATYME